MGKASPVFKYAVRPLYLGQDGVACGEHACDDVVHDLGIVVDVHWVGLDGIDHAFGVSAVGVPCGCAEARRLGDVGQRFAVDEFAFEEPVEHLLADGGLQTVVGQQVGAMSAVVVLQTILFAGVCAFWIDSEEGRKA